jgi:hypothetical protein
MLHLIGDIKFGYAPRWKLIAIKPLLLQDTRLQSIDFVII